MNYNISPETIKGMHKTVPGVDEMLTQSFDTSFLKEKQETITPNGALFDCTKYGFLPELLLQMYDSIFPPHPLLLNRKYGSALPTPIRASIAEYARDD